MDVSQEQMMGWIRDLAGFGARRAGTLAGQRCEDYLADQLSGFGLESVRKEAIAVERWEPETAEFAVLEQGHWETIPAQWIPYAAFTPAAGIEAPLVYATPDLFGRRADWRGKIVVADIHFPMLQASLLRRLSLGTYDPDDDLVDVKHPATWVRLNWHLYHQAAHRGAVGFVGILRDQPGGTHQMYGPYGFKEKNILDKPIPGCWVSRAVGPRLVERCLGRARALGRVVLCGSRGPGTTHNVVGELPGTSNEAVIIHCHHDSPFASPVEDASGCAVVLAVAKHLARQPRLRRRVIVLLTAGHFYGSIGTRTFIQRHQETLLPDVALEITTEHIAREAVENAQGALVPSGKTEATGVFVPFQRRLAELILEKVRKNRLQRVLLLPPEGPLGDYPPTDGGDWYPAGIPLINFISNPVYLLTADDDFGWVDEPRLPRLASTVVDIIVGIESWSKEELAATDLTLRRWLMRGLMHLMKAKTTCFGTRPIY